MLTSEHQREINKFKRPKDGPGSKNGKINQIGVAVAKTLVCVCDRVVVHLNGF